MLFRIPIIVDIWVNIHLIYYTNLFNPPQWG